MLSNQYPQEPHEHDRQHDRKGGWFFRKLRFGRSNKKCTTGRVERRGSGVSSDFTDLTSTTSSTASSYISSSDNNNNNNCNRPISSSSPPPVPTTINADACEMPYSYNHGGVSYQGFYVGEIKCGKPHGSGTWSTVHTNGAIRIEGEWYCGFNISGQKQLVGQDSMPPPPPPAPTATTSASSTTSLSSQTRISGFKEAYYFMLPSVFEEEDEDDFNDSACDSAV